ncbi:MAG: plasmid mobilization relaxosome protein MobC [Gammaproteobacteria bacterium]|nr:plasmid mobilization relaxosome protein MobC [Gammaproteobacteria bacterium]MBL4729744.1 plasmid mobilization relaxosome protein MobC [Gammaproteobacteria bacterium]
MKTLAINTRVEPTLKEDFALLAKREGKTSSAMLRDMVADRVKNFREHPPRRALEQGVIGPRWKVVNTRLSSSEWEKAKKHIAAENMSVTGWVLSLIRAAILKKPQLRKDEVRAVLEANYQLRSIGRNLNQMVRAVNDGRAERGEFSEHYAKRLKTHIDAVTLAIGLLVTNSTKRDVSDE